MPRSQASKPASAQARCNNFSPSSRKSGSLIAAISAAVDASQADHLDEIGAALNATVATLGPKYDLKPS
jgi:hypothetical protein